MNLVTYLGPEGTFSHQAALYWALNNPGAELRPVADLLEAVQEVIDGRAQVAVLPAENSIEGTVNLTLDLLLERPDLSICGEIVLEVRHCLATLASSVEEITAVYSHSQALAQCRRFIKKKLPAVTVSAVSSTAAAMRQAAADRRLAAIGPVFAARLYNLPVLYHDIQDYPGNKTRFLVVGKDKKMPPTGSDKTSLVLALPENRPGGLYRALAVFAAAEINLTRIESRPTKKELGEYLFFLDCEGHAEVEPLRSVLRELEPKTALLKILGSYPKYRGEQDA
ncbi:MAG: prephenate dehydratase [Clostridia bacterium]|nr:prephenate dehydratase [Clostridia bacterium]